MSACAECGMEVSPVEYHPYAACLMFKGCKDGHVVRENLKAVVERAKAWAPAFPTKPGSQP